MSEIFEALRKAQREADARRVEGIGRTPGTDVPVAPAAAPAPAAPQAPPAPPVVEPAVAHKAAPPSAPRRHHRLWTWIRAFFRGPRRGAVQGIPTPLFKAGRGTAVGEQFRVLRSRIETVGFGTFMVTSALDREGKTLCATNLAFALSTSLGAGVVLIDADLRRPNVGTWFGIRGGNGLAECLLGDARWTECLRTTEYERLRVLPAGRETGLSTELLASERMANLLDEIKAANPRHYVIVDAPPLLLTADPLVLARHVDHAVLVVRAGVTPRAAVQKAIEMLGTERFLGIVLNGASEKFSDYYQYRYGRYGYGYGGSEAQE